ncbi:hypothetical protein [Saccharopolyspora taberi]|uniref:DUF2637 domain-containing protein n=1 Tax=Saccharopolyspora taberi TaxID=60895 RepID=A0ABN3VMU4_9PSEU
MTTLAPSLPRRSTLTRPTQQRRPAGTAPTLGRRFSDATATVEAHLPILAAAGIAFSGQMGFAADVLKYGFVGQVLYAVGVETLSYSMARLWSRARRRNQRGRLALSVTWLFALYAAGTNYWNHSRDLTPSPTAVAFGVLSVAGVAAYLVHERYRIRQHIRDRRRTVTSAVAERTPRPHTNDGTSQPPTPPQIVVTVLPPRTPARLTLPANADEGPSHLPVLTDAQDDAKLTATEKARRWLDKQVTVHNRDLGTIKATEVAEASGLKSHAREVLRKYKAERGVAEEDTPAKPASRQTT